MQIIIILSFQVGSQSNLAESRHCAPTSRQARRRERTGDVYSVKENNFIDPFFYCVKITLNIILYRLALDAGFRFDTIDNYLD